MKNITLICLLFAQYSVLSSPVLRQGNPSYAVVADQYCANVPPNKCRVRGTATYNGIPIENCIIATYPKTISTHTDSEGQYGLMLIETDSVIYFFDRQYGEIVIYPYHFKGGHEVVLDFYAENTWLYPEADKPVIYLHSSTPIDVELSLKFKGEMTFSYPNYENGWRVNVSGDDIYDKVSHSNYPYLFWEGRYPYLDFVYVENEMNGFVIKTDTIVSFLENQLAFLGLNRHETTDFITYWAPQMIHYNFIVAQFLMDDVYEKFIAEIVINPKPDSMQRIFMLFKGYDDRPTFEVKPQNFNSFERFGFSVVEWGGSDLTQSSQ